MMRSERLRRAVGQVRQHWGDRHYRNGYYLMLNSLVGAAAGLLFWLVLVRMYGLPDRDIGIGVAAIALCTAFALIAKGGLDAALVRHVPRATRSQGLHLLELAVSVSFVIVAALVVLLAVGPRLVGVSLAGLTGPALSLMGALAALLAVTWLQDAHFLAEGEARFSFYRNLVFHSARLATPALVLLLALPYTIPTAWGLALLLSALAAMVLLRALPDDRGVPQNGEPHAHASLVPKREFLRSAGRNVAGSAAEFLPGLLLVPFVLHLEGAEAAAYFGIAWTGASMLFLLSAAICRSTFAEMSRHGNHAHYLRRAVRHHVLIVGPAAIAAVAVSPFLLRLFGPGYALHGQPVFGLLAASIVLVAPVYLYLALLRSREDRVLLLVFPAAMVGALFSLAPMLEERLGLAGVGVAWLLAHAPLALFAIVQIRRALAAPAAPHPEVTHGPAEPAQAHGRAPHLE